MPGVLNQGKFLSLAYDGKFHFISVTAEALRTNVDWKSPFLKGKVVIWPKISGGTRHPQSPPTVLHVGKQDESTFHTV